MITTHSSSNCIYSFHITDRLIVQSAPPFLAVHINAAFSRLTGIHNTSVIGRPVSKILELALADQQHRPQSPPNTMMTMAKESSSPSCSSGRSKETLQDMEGKEMVKTDKSSLSSHENSTAVPVGMRAAAAAVKTEERYFSIDRLIASSGFGNWHKVKTLDIRVSTPSSDGSNNGSHNSSISSKEPPINPIVCIMSVCPVMNTAPHQHSHSHAPSPKHPGSTASSKRRKHTHPHQHQHRQSTGTPARRSNVKHVGPTHFVVQLFSVEEGQGQTIEVELEKVGIGPSSNDDDDDGSMRDGAGGIGDGSPADDEQTHTTGGSSGSKPLVACG